MGHAHDQNIHLFTYVQRLYLKLDILCTCIQLDFWPTELVLFFYLLPSLCDKIIEKCSYSDPSNKNVLTLTPLISMQQILLFLRNFSHQHALLEPPRLLLLRNLPPIQFLFDELKPPLLFDFGISS